MGIRYQKRINLGKGAGLNLSKSGISASYKTKYGSISPKGFSIRTGIPGLTYRGGKNSSAAGVMLVVAVIMVSVLFIRWLAREAYHYALRRKMDFLQEEERTDCNSLVEGDDQ